MSGKRLKIFISAYACEPEKGSEPGIGWNVVNELAKYHEVHVLTRANNRPAIEAASAGKSVTPVFHYYDLPKWLSFWKKKRRGYHLYYFLWQYGAFFKYRKFADTYGFDIVQHLTFANYAMPSLFMLCKPTTVWGPIGKTAIPAPVFKALPAKVKIKETLRKWSMELMSHCEIGRVLTARRADWIVESGVAPDRSNFPARWRKKIVRHPQTGVNTAEVEYRTVRKRENDGKVRLLICSEFLHWKGVTFAAEVYGRIASQRSDVELYICGSGPGKHAMQAIFCRHGVENSVTWLGFVNKAEMLQNLRDADILLYPSYHHGLATVILQAMYVGLPVVTIAGDPIALCLSEGGGIVVDGGTMDEIMDELTAAVLRLVEHPEERRKLGECGHRLIETRYEWSVMTEKLSELLISLAAR